MLNHNIASEMNGVYWEEMMFSFTYYCEAQPNLWFDDVTDAMLVDFIKMNCGA